jgi:hypothetical protein
VYIIARWTWVLKSDNYAYLLVLRSNLFFQTRTHPYLLFSTRVLSSKQLLWPTPPKFPPIFPNFYTILWMTNKKNMNMCLIIKKKKKKRSSLVSRQNIWSKYYLFWTKMVILLEIQKKGVKMQKILHFSTRVLSCILNSHYTPTLNCCLVPGYYPAKKSSHHAVV